MTGDTVPKAFTLLGDRPPAWLERWVVVVAPGRAQPCAPEAYARAIAVLEHGSITLEQVTGARLRLEEGAVFPVGRAGLVAMHNESAVTAVIACGRRRPAASPQV